jgi:hypothetical protein
MLAVRMTLTSWFDESPTDDCAREHRSYGAGLSWLPGTAASAA